MQSEGRSEKSEHSSRNVDKTSTGASCVDHDEASSFPSPPKTPAQILDDYEFAAKVRYGREEDLPNPRADEQSENMTCRDVSLRLLEDLMEKHSMTESSDAVDHGGEWERISEQCKEDGKEVTVRSLYPALGWVLLRDLSRAFYDNVWSDEADWFRSQFQRELGKEQEVMNQWTFFVEHFGGPKVFEEWRNFGGADLVEFTHTSQSFNMTSAGLRRWLSHMAKAMRTVGMLEKCPEAIPIIMDWFDQFGFRMIKASNRY